MQNHRNMKHNVTRLKTALFLCMITGANLFAGNAEEGQKEGALQLYCSDELSVLAGNLAGQYEKENPGFEIRVSTLPPEGGSELINPRSLVLGNKACLERFNREEYLSLVLGRDVIVPIINAGNPLAGEIREKGLTMAQFSSIYGGNASMTWGELTGSGGGKPIQVLVPGGSCGRNYLSAYLGGANPAGEVIGSPVEMISRVEASAAAIGFCNLACLEGILREGAGSGIALVPIDVDGNGELSYFEDIYGSFESLKHGIYVGKYPSPLYTRIYALAADEPAREGRAFLEWMLGKGQEQLAGVFLLPAEYSEKTAGIRALTPMPVTTGVHKANVPVILLFGMLALGLLIPLVWLMMRPRRPGIHERQYSGDLQQAFSLDAEKHPSGLFYDRSHTWAIMEPDGQARVGMDAFIPGITGRLTRIEMKKPGEKVKRGETLLSLVRDGKRLEVKSPVSGEISACNDNIAEEPALLLTSPYEEGWLFRIRPSDWRSETARFLMVDPYIDFLKKELERMKDFFAGAISGEVESRPVILQDGGQLMEGALGPCDPRTWEMFQGEFL